MLFYENLIRQTNLAPSGQIAGVAKAQSYVLVSLSEYEQI